MVKHYNVSFEETPKWTACRYCHNAAYYKVSPTDCEPLYLCEEHASADTVQYTLVTQRYNWVLEKLGLNEIYLRNI